MRTIIAAAFLVATPLVAGCSDSGTSLPAPPEPTAASPDAGSTSDTGPHYTGAVATDGAGQTDGAAVTEVPAAPTAPELLEPVPETGIPGLDSDDVFCAAWSRFGGTWQVLSVGAAFLEDPVAVAGWEAAASPVVLAAFDDLAANFPTELDAERDVALGEYFGVLRQRIQTANAALTAAGATDDDLARLAQAWLGALAVRDQFDADIGLELTAGLQAIVDDAALAVLAERGPFNLDPTMIVTALTPATDDYLATECPDRGALAGQEVGGEGG